MLSANGLVAVCFPAFSSHRLHCVYRVMAHGLVLPNLAVFRYHGPFMTLPTESAPSSRRRAIRDVLLYGVCGGVLIVVLKLTEYRFLVVEHSVEIYGALVAALFAALGIWLGLTLTRKKPLTIIKEVPAQPTEPFVADQTRLTKLGITARELEILGLIAAGLSNREIAGRLFVSENTVKTHSSRLFDKLGAKRRTQAVQIGKTARLIP
jgi:two-component system, NarL family, response regulator LiaR